jgi:hypothetical protein
LNTTNAIDLDRSPQKVIDLLQPLVYIFYFADYILLQQIGQKWLRLQAFAKFTWTIFGL